MTTKTIETEKAPLFLDGDESISPVEFKPKFKKDFKEFSLETDVDAIATGWWPKVTGSCLCKLSIVFYLLLCVGLSVLYVGLRYTHETEPEDTPLPWIPGTPTVVQDRPPPPVHQQLHFQDLPYTEWIAKRWTYNDAPFADWPSLPSFINNITQISSGTIGKRRGVWVLTDSDLFFGTNFYEDVEFLNVSETIGLSVSAGSMVTVATGGEVYLATPINITLLDCSSDFEDYCEVVTSNSQPLPYTSVHSTVFSLSTGGLWLGTDTGLYLATTKLPTSLYISEDLFFDGDIVISNVTEVEGQVQTLLWRSSVDQHSAFILVPGAVNTRQVTLAFSTSQGTTLQSTSLAFSTSEELAKAIKDQDSFGVLLVGTKDRLYFYDGQRWWFEWVSVWTMGLGGVIDGPPTAMAVGTAGEIYIANNVSMTRINTNYTFDRIGPLQGLPYNQLKALCFVNYQPTAPHPTKGYKGRTSNSGMLWIGTGRGYALFDLQSSEFKHYFYGPRWHSGEEIKAIASIGGAGVVMVTDRGLTFVTPEEWTLAKKAAHYQKMLARHTREPGIVSDCPLTVYNVTTCSPYTTDNDGLWTSWLVGAESLRYAVTGNTSARENAWSLFQGMAFLNNVTGVRGLMARSVLHENSTVPGGVWHNSTSIPGWLWKGDTSSDEVVGHMFAYPLVHDLVARNEEERAVASGLVDDIVGYIKSNDYHLMDVSNQSTRWGVWAPSQLNLNVSWADEHGLNSLQILSYLLSAYRLTGKTEYWDAWKELADHPDNHYGLNMVNQKITFPRDNNFSDDELAFLPYFTYCQANQMMKNPVDAQVSYYGNLSLERTWSVVGQEKSSAWSAIYAYCTGSRSDPALLDALVWTLRSWPLELVEWRTANSHRLDITHNPEQDRDMHTNSQSVKLLPANERGQLRWNTSPYQLDSGGASSEMDPGAWLLPYWLARWTGML